MCLHLKQLQFLKPSKSLSMSAIRSSSMVLLICCVLSANMLMAQDFVTKVDIKSEQASFKLEDQKTLLVEIAGPDDYQYSQEHTVKENEPVFIR